MGGNLLEKKEKHVYHKNLFRHYNNSPIDLIFKNYIVFTSSHPLF